MHLEIKDVCKAFGPVVLFKELICSCEASVIGLVGASGSGKSSLLRLIAGLETPDKGTIEIDGCAMPTVEGAGMEAHRKSIGVVFQSWNLFPHLSALENIVLPLRVCHGMSKEEALITSRELLVRFDLAHHENKKPGQLSGGQNQRVAIVRAIAHKPKMLLLDEPTSALDPVMTSEVLDLLAELKKEGCAFILASHHIPFLRNITEQIVFMHEGKIVENASSKHFFSKPETALAEQYLKTILKYQL
jgi:polar amino acid transport system ATP-binding protein